MNCHCAQFFVIADKNLRDKGCTDKAENGHCNACYWDDAHAFREEAAKLLVVLCAVVVADKRCDSDAVADEDRDEYEVYVHEYAVCCYAVLASIFE